MIYELQNPCEHVVYAEIKEVDNGHFYTYYLLVKYRVETSQYTHMTKSMNYFGRDTLGQAKADYTRDWQRPSQGYERPIWKEVKPD